jgi:hypothetical protein
MSQYEGAGAPDFMWRTNPCTVTTFGSTNLTAGGSAFGPGRYSLADLEAKGAKNDDIEVLDVGWGCEAEIFQNSWGGWTATLGPGTHGQADIEGRGGQINSASAMIVRQTQTKSRPMLLKARVQVRARAGPFPVMEFSSG